MNLSYSEKNYSDKVIKYNFFALNFTKRVEGKVLFSRLCVILSTWGVCLFPACITGHMTKGGLPPGGSASR